MENQVYAVIQSRGEVSFLVAVFLAEFDARHFAEKLGKNPGAYSFRVEAIADSGWGICEREAYL
jgi:hypothetical protein